MPITVTYPIPDEPYVNSWDEGKTLTTTYNGPDDVTLYANQDGHVFGTSFDYDSDTAHAMNSDALLGDGSPTLNIRLKASSSNNHAMACWYLQNFHDEDATDMPHEEIEEERTLAADPSQKYKVVTNPNIHKVFEMFVSKDTDSDGNKFDNIRWKQIVRSPESHNAFLARTRKAAVQHYYDHYDLGPAGESDAAAYLTKVDEFIAGEEGKWPWAYITHPSTSLVPKIPLTVNQAIKVVKEAGDMGLTEGEMTENGWGGSPGPVRDPRDSLPYKLPEPIEGPEVFKVISD